MTTPNQAVPSKCLHCQSALETPIVCGDCQTLYPLPEKVDYFDLFRLPRRYRLNVDELERKFLSITRNIHPDYFGGESVEMRQLAIRLSAELNEALRVLKDPVMRAGYLLEQSGGKSATQDRGVPQSVLTEVMTLREELEEADGEPRAVAEVHSQAKRRRGETLEHIADLADHLPEATDGDRAELRRLINSVKYYDNLLAEMPAAGSGVGQA